jgi:hypothetical protein
MLKLLCTLSMLSLTAIPSAFAQGTAQAPGGYECNDASMARMETVASGMTDATKKAAAMKHVSSMRDAMTKKDMAACTTLLKETNSYFPDTTK